jgi:hypothetical protein
MPLVTALPRDLLAQENLGGRAVLRRVRPGDSAWPSQAKWMNLADEVGGNLIKVRPLFGAGEDPGKDLRKQRGVECGWLRSFEGLV